MEAVEVEASPEVHQEVEEPLGIGDEGALGEGEEEGASVLGEVVEGAIPTSRGLAIVAVDRNRIRPGVGAKGVIFDISKMDFLQKDSPIEHI